MGMPLDGGTAETHVGGDYTADEIEFLKAIEAYKRTRRRPFPAWTEVLRVLQSLGYRKVEASRLPDGEGGNGGAGRAAETGRPPARPKPRRKQRTQSEGAPCPSSAESPPS